MSNVALPFADCVEPYLPAVGASLPQILPQINLYPLAHYAAGHPSVFLYFPTTARTCRNAVSVGNFSGNGGNRSFGEIISQSGSSQLSSAWPWVLAYDAPLCRFELPILFYSRKVFQLTFSLKPVILSPCRFPPFYRHTSSVPLYYCT